MKKQTLIYQLIAAIIVLQSCTVIHPGQVALDVHYGKINRILMPGPHHVGIGKKVIRFDATIQNYSEIIKFPTKEGIEITSEITLLYHFIPDSLKSIYLKFGKEYQNILIINNLISIVRQAGLNYKANELITQRIQLEKTIHDKMVAVISKYGFEIDLVLLKDVDLPPDVVQTIQNKLNAEQLAEKTKIDIGIKKQELDYSIEKQKREAELEVDKQRIALNFVVEKQNKEAERMLIEAEATKKSQDIINSTLTDKLLKFKSLEITKALISSGNSKIIITDGKSPVIVGDK